MTGWLPDISGHWNKIDYDKCRKLLIELNETLGDDYKVELTGNIWVDFELLNEAQNDYRRDYTA